MTIKSLGNHRVLTHSQAGRVTLDFNPILNKIQTIPEPIIMHWNKILCLFGFYDPLNNQYLAVPADKILKFTDNHELVEVCKKDFPNILPTAVVVYPMAKMGMIDGNLVLESVNDESL